MAEIRGSTGCSQLLAYGVRGCVLTIGVGVVHRGGGDVGQREVTDVDDLEAGGLELVGGVRGGAVFPGDVQHVYFGHGCGGRGACRGRRGRRAGAGRTAGHRRCRVIVGVPGRTDGLPPEQQEYHAEEQQHHHHGPQGKPRGVGDALIHRAHCSSAGRVSGHLEAEAPRRACLLTAGTQPSQPFHQHWVRGKRLGPID